MRLPPAAGPLRGPAARHHPRISSASGDARLRALLHDRHVSQTSKRTDDGCCTRTASGADGCTSGRDDAKQAVPRLARSRLDHRDRRVARRLVLPGAHLPTPARAVHPFAERPWLQKRAATVVAAPGAGRRRIARGARDHAASGRRGTRPKGCPSVAASRRCSTSPECCWPGSRQSASGSSSGPRGR